MALILGGLAALGTPMFASTPERMRAQTGLRYLQAVHAAQEEYHARNGAYAPSLRELRAKLPLLTDFVARPMAYFDPVTRRRHWSLTIVRRNPHTEYGRYTMVFNQAGFDACRSTISRFPAIDPHAHVEVRTRRRTLP